MWGETRRNGLLPFFFVSSSPSASLTLFFPLPKLPPFTPPPLSLSTMALALHIAARRTAAVFALSSQQRCASEASVLLRKLRLEETNHGVFDGQWHAGKGDVIESLNPCNNEVLASVTQVLTIKRRARTLEREPVSSIGSSHVEMRD